MINKVENINILLKFQYAQTILFFAYIRDILVSSCKRPIENGIIFVGDKINLDSIGQHIVPYGKVDGSSSSNVKLSINNCKGLVEWVDVKSDPFVCLALKPTLSQNLLIMMAHMYLSSS
jgi:hypothetical protein